jgi:rare lipoprotein A (peptidoglycan hydrolase)
MVIYTLSVALAIASWYTVADNGGHQTASGIPFSDHEKTCAHRTHKFGTLLQVVNTTNGKTTYCTVTDRGPYIKGRVVDLSPVGAKELGMVGSGIAPVKIAVVPPSTAPSELPPLKGLDPYEVDRQDLPPVVEKQSKQSHSKPSPRRAKPVSARRKAGSQARSSRPLTKPLDAWQETRRNLRST